MKWGPVRRKLVLRVVMIRLLKLLRLNRRMRRDLIRWMIGCVCRRVVFRVENPWFKLPYGMTPPLTPCIVNALPEGFWRWWMERREYCNKPTGR